MAAAPWLLLGLLRAACALTSPQATAPRRVAPPSAPPPTPQPATPIRNLRLDPAWRRLSWDLMDNDVIAAGSSFRCRKGRLLSVSADDEGRSCSFPTLSLCHVTTLSAFPKGREDLAASIRFPDPHPDPDSAARDLRCWVHDVNRLACRWGRGLGVADDVRYRMFWRDARLGPDRDRECPGYEASGLGCDLELDPATLDPSSTRDPPNVLMVTVNGSVGVAGGVACNDLAVIPQSEEVLAPPTVEANCTASQAHVRWAWLSWFQSSRTFTLEVNQSSRSWTEELSVTEHRIPHPGPTLSVRVRAVSEDGDKVSAWSPAYSLECDPEASPARTQLWPLLLGVGAGLTAMAVTSLLLRWRKPLLLARLFPPIPRMRVTVEAPEEVVAWMAEPEDCEVTAVMDSA